jgi:ABC-type transport system involved in cytochrome bd biosynthesis fused ATPase/permease subunit
LPASITRQLLIARALAEDPRLFLVEEGFLPTELSSDNSFLQYLLDRTKPFTAVVITAHPEYLQKCDRILALKDGHLYWSGSYEGLLAHPDYTDLVPQNMPNN